MARLQAGKVIPQSSLDDVKNKTADAALMALTAECLLADYRRNILTALRTQAAAVANIDRRVIDVRNVVIASSQLTPDAIRTALNQVTQLLTDSSLKQRETLLDVLDELGLS